MGKRGQVALEYMAVVGFVLFITLPLIILFQTSTESLSDEIVASHLQSLGQKIADNAQSVYYLGPPAQTTFRVYIPPGVVSATVESREIVFLIQRKSGTDSIVILSPVNLTGTLSTSQGTRLITVQAQPGVVWVSG